MTGMIKQKLMSLAVAANRITERAHLRLQPVHYYSEVPNRRWLEQHRSEWAHPALPAGIDWDLDSQLVWLSRICSAHLSEVPALSEWQSGLGFGPGYGPIEAQVLRCFVRSEQPEHVVEVGSGMSTAVIFRASETNNLHGGRISEITCVEPYPREALRSLDVRLIESGALSVPLAVFTELKSGDLLFIDSTHALHTGSELIRLYLDILPALAPGVLVHIHDIYLPYMYSPDVLSTLFDWQETVLLAALLINNPKLKVRCCLSALSHERPHELRKILPDYRPASFTDGLGITGNSHFPASIWLESV